MKFNQYQCIISRTEMIATDRSLLAISVVEEVKNVVYPACQHWAPYIRISIRKRNERELCREVIRCAQ